MASLRAHVNVNTGATVYFTNTPERIASDQYLTDLVVILPDASAAATWGAGKTAAMTANPTLTLGTYISSRIAVPDANLLYYPRETLALADYDAGQYYGIPADRPEGQYIDYSQLAARTEMVAYIAGVATTRGEDIILTDNWAHPSSGATIPAWSVTMTYMAALKTAVNATATDLFVNLAGAIGAADILEADITSLAANCDGVTLEQAMHSNIGTDAARLTHAVACYAILVNAGVTIIFLPTLAAGYTEAQYNSEAAFLAGLAMVLNGPLVHYPFFYANPAWHLYPDTYGPPTAAIQQSGTTLSREFGSTTFTVDCSARTVTITEGPVNALLAAIVAKYQTATAITSSGPWFDMAEDNAAYPYGIISIIGTGGHQPYYDNTYDEVVDVRFTLFDDNFADVGTAQDNLNTRFDKVKLTLSVGRNYHTLRSGQMRRYAGQDKSGVSVYQAISDYRFKVNKSY